MIEYLLKWWGLLTQNWLSLRKASCFLMLISFFLIVFTPRLGPWHSGRKVRFWKCKTDFRRGQWRLSRVAASSGRCKYQEGWGRVWAAQSQWRLNLPPSQSSLRQKCHFGCKPTRYPLPMRCWCWQISPSLYLYPARTSTAGSFSCTINGSLKVHYKQLSLSLHIA